MKKKFVTLLLATSMVLSLVGCKSNSDSNKKPNDTTKKETNVLGFASYDYILKVMGSKESSDKSTLYKYADFITLGEYKGLEAEVDPALKVVTDEDYKSSLDNILDQYKTTNTLTTGTVKEGDKINLDFKGLLDGVAFDNGTATDYDYTLGGGFIEDLDKGLVGLEVGKQYSIPCKFPEDYGKEELNGKDVVFEVTVNYIVEEVAAELNDELAKKIATDNNLSDSFDSVETLEKYLREQLEKQAVAEFEDAKFGSAWEKILANAKYDGMPEVDYEATYNSLVTNAKNQFTQYEAYGFDWATFLSLNGYETEDAFTKDCETKANDYIKTKLAIMAIADKEGFTVTDDEFNECANQYVTAYGFENLDALYDYVGNSKQAFIEERYYEVLYKKVYDFIIANCKEVEKPAQTEN